MTRLSLLDHFSALADPRQHGKVLYPLPEIILLILCGTLTVAEDFVEIREWGARSCAFCAGSAPSRVAFPRMTG